jgi:hypothetical protein
VDRAETPAEEQTAVTAALAGRKAVKTPAIPAGTRFSPLYQSGRHSTLAVGEWNSSSASNVGSVSAATAPKPGAVKDSMTIAENTRIQSEAVITGAITAVDGKG